jgi:hypothetical protein
MIYHTITDKISEEKKLEVDMILGSTEARDEIKERRQNNVAAAGFEVG